MNKKRILCIGDGFTPTGFSTVIHNILGNLVEDFEIHHLAVNYRGDPHNYNWKMYPSWLAGDPKGEPMGFNRLPSFANTHFDLIFILNDVWVVNQYLEIIKANFKPIPPVVVYFPVDSVGHDIVWYKNFDIVKKIVVYTSFGKTEVNATIDNSDIEIIPHGVNSKVFYKLYKEDRNEIKSRVFTNSSLEKDSFIVLSAHRNQPRKRLDLTIKGFALFAENKPDNVALYLHCGTKDLGFDILKLCQRYGVGERLILTNTERIIQVIPEEKLNLIYNATDVGICNSTGEGWSLTNMEHAITGAPQIVPSHSALTELYNDCGILMPIYMWLENRETLSIGGYVHPIDIANSLEKLYSDKDLYNDLSKKSIEKFTSSEYEWENIVKNKWLPLFNEVINGN